MDNKPEYLLNTNFPRRKILESSYKNSNPQTFGTKNKEGFRVNKEVSILEDAFLHKLDMC